MSYITIDTLVATNAARTNSVRLSATEGTDGRSSLLYTAREFRIVLFDPTLHVAGLMNETVAALSGDSNMLNELEEFTNKYIL